MPPKRKAKPAPPSKPFDALTKNERDAWRSLPGTRAFKAHLYVLASDANQAMLAAVEKGADAKLSVGFIRAMETVIRELLSDPQARPEVVEEEFRDPAMPPSYYNQEPVPS